MKLIIPVTSTTSTDLGSDTAARAVIVHEDLEHLGHDLGQVDLELGAEGADNLLQQQDDCVLHRTVDGPVVLQKMSPQRIIGQYSTFSLCDINNVEHFTIA